MQGYIKDSFQGQNRLINKDRILFLENKIGVLAVVFDGISSAKDANEAIDIAVKFLQQNWEKLNTTDSYDLADLMYEVNGEIFKSSLDAPYSTYCAFYLRRNEASAQISSLWDSRVYEVTSQYIKQLTEDDNLVNNKNVVTKYLGMIELERADVGNFYVDVVGKKFLLCSDGFYHSLESNLKRFHRVLNFKSPKRVLNALSVEVQKSNSDDASYIFIY